MSPILLKFIANFIAIIVLAITIDSRKDMLACYVMAKCDEIDTETVVKGMHMMNTISLTFVSAINAYACFSEKSSNHLTTIGLAYLCDLLIFGIFMSGKTKEKDEGVLLRIPTTRKYK